MYLTTFKSKTQTVSQWSLKNQSHPVMEKNIYIACLKWPPEGLIGCFEWNLWQGAQSGGPCGQKGFSEHTVLLGRLSFYSSRESPGSGSLCLPSLPARWSSAPGLWWNWMISSDVLQNPTPWHSVISNKDTYIKLANLLDDGVVCFCRPDKAISITLSLFNKHNREEFISSFLQLSEVNFFFLPCLRGNSLVHASEGPGRHRAHRWGRTQQGPDQDTPRPLLPVCLLQSTPSPPCPSPTGHGGKGRW